jgi:hypothetical protein
MVATLEEYMDLPFPMLKGQRVVNPDDVPRYSKDEYDYPLLLNEGKIDQQQKGGLSAAHGQPIDLAELTAGHIGKLIHDNRLCRAFLLEEAGLGGHRAPKSALLVKNDSHFRPKIGIHPPDESLVFNLSTYFTSTEATTQQKVHFSAKIDGTYAGISPSAYVANVSSKDTSSKVSKAYGIASYVFPSIEFDRFDAKSGPFEVNPEMIADSKKVNNIDDAKTFFDNWGFAMPSRFVLGQTITFRKEVSFKKGITKESAKTEAELSIQSAVVSAETGIAKEDTYTSAEVRESTDIVATVTSGSLPPTMTPERAYELGNFRHNPLAWKQCDILEFVPILSLLEKAEMDVISRLLQPPRMMLCNLALHAGDHWGFSKTEGIATNKG